MRQHLREQGIGYLIAIGATAVALLLRMALADVLQDHAEFMTFVVAVAAAAWHGGLWPGLLATALGVAGGTYFFAYPLHSFYVASRAERADALLFFGAAVVISSAMEAMHNSRRRVEVQRRQLEKLNRQRDEAEEALRQADRRKDEFLGTLAHELRNPLAPILNSMQLLRMNDSPEPEVEQVCDIVERQVSYMRLIIDDLMDTTRIAQNKLQLHTQRVSLAAIVERVVETSRPLIETAGHELTVSLPPRPIYLEADPTRLAQVFINLLNNAGKYTDPPGRIDLSVVQHDGEAVVKIKDNGVGIQPELLPHLFEMYVQVDRSLKRSQGGLGLGLPLVQRLVHRHGGSVAAHSDGPGHGSEFVVRLPVAIDAPAATQVPHLA